MGRVTPAQHGERHRCSQETLLAPRRSRKCPAPAGRGASGSAGRSSAGEVRQPAPVRAVTATRSWRPPPVQSAWGWEAAPSPRTSLPAVRGIGRVRHSLTTRDPRSHWAPGGKAAPRYPFPARLGSGLHYHAMVSRTARRTSVTRECRSPACSRTFRDRSTCTTCDVSRRVGESPSQTYAHIVGRRSLAPPASSAPKDALAGTPSLQPPPSCTCDPLTAP